MGWCIHQDVEIISDDDSLDTNRSVSESDWETISDYYSESEDDFLPDLLIIRLVAGDSDDDSSIESMEDSLSEESDDDFFDTHECFAQEKKQGVKKNLEEVILDSASTISIFKDACFVKNIRKAKP